MSGKLISSDADTVHLHTTHTMLQAQKGPHLPKKFPSPGQNLLVLTGDPSLVALVVQHPLFPQKTFRYIRNKDCPT